MGGKETGLTEARAAAPAARTSFALYVLLGPSIAVAVALAAFSLSRDIGEVRTGGFPGLPLAPATASPATPTNASAAPRDPSQAPAVSTQAPTATPRITTGAPTPTARPDDITPRPTAAPTLAPTIPPSLAPTVPPTSAPILPTLPPVPTPPIGLRSPGGLP